MKNLAKNTKVQVHYRGTLTSGEEFDSSLGKEPLAFTIGAGEVLAEFENAVRQLGVGEKTEIDLTPEQAYGEYKEELVLSIPKKNFPAEIKIEQGAMLNLRNPEGQEILAIIDAIEGDSVQVNANHPLAGQALHFEIELVSAEL